MERQIKVNYMKVQIWPNYKNYQSYIYVKTTNMLWELVSREQAQEVEIFMQN